MALSHSGGECRVREIGPTTDEPFATLRLTTGTLTLTNGDTTLGGGCTGYEAPDTIERIEITNGDATVGTLSVVSLGNDVEGANVNTASAPPAAGDADAPTAHHVVYGVPVEVTVATERTTTSRLVIVAPGNRPNPLPSPRYEDSPPIAEQSRSLLSTPFSRSLRSGFSQRSRQASRQ